MHSVYYLFFQMYVRAYDRGIPALTATSLVQVFINVFRNNNPPRFINAPYTTTISRDQTVNANIFQVSAVDNDNNVIQASLLQSAHSFT
jgi:hypothetical protein